jgi:hypothetical protein
MSLGEWSASVPISVAHVSAAEAAIAPAANGNQTGDGLISEPIAAAVNTPPFATTCQASRSPHFSTVAPIRTSLVVRR